MEQNYWVIIPPAIAGSDLISARAKYLFGRIYALSQKDGYCYASNDYLSVGTGLEVRTLQRVLLELKKAGFIDIEVIRDEKKAIVGRHIVIGLPLMSNLTLPSVKSDATPSVKSDAIDKESILDKEKSIIYKGIFEFWNSLGIIKHTDKGKTYEQAKKQINGIMNEGYKEIDITTSMSNYAKILQSPIYYWSHKWTITEFLSRGFERFRDWDVCSTNFLKKTNTAQPAKRFEGEDFSKYDKFNK